jgi:hypothetical protein
MSNEDNRAATTGDGPVRGEIREVGFRRVSHGLYLPVSTGLDGDREFLRDLDAWKLVLPERSLFTHVTGARLRGWQLPRLPEQVPIFAAVEGDRPRPRRPGLVCSRLRRPHEPDERYPLAERAEEILLRAARDLGTLDVTVLLNSARHRGDVDDERMTAALTSRRPGSRVLRQAWRLSSPGAESPGETLLDVFHRAMEVPVRPQALLTRSDGSVIGRADLLVVGTRFVHEYDGAVHRDLKQHKSDLRRDRELHAAGYVRRGYTQDELLNHPLVVMHEIDRALDRPHRLGRLTRWRALVENSLFSEVGRRRVMNRWNRLAGTVDWSRTA